MLMRIGRWNPTICCRRDTKSTRRLSLRKLTFLSCTDVSLDIITVLSHKRCSCDGASLTPSRLKRGDLGQLAPRKKLLKSFRAFLEDFLRSLQAFGTEGFLFLAPSLLTLNHL